MDCSMPGFPVLHYLPEFAQIHGLWVGDAIPPSHPLSPPPPLALSLSQHQGLFHWVLYIYPLLPGFPSHLGRHRALSRLPVLYSRFSLVIYFMHSNNSVYVSELSSAFILSSIHLLLFCPATCFPPDFQPPTGGASASPFFPTPTCHMDWLILESASK